MVKPKMRPKSKVAAANAKKKRPKGSKKKKQKLNLTSKKKKSLFARPNPMKRKLKVKQRKLRNYFIRHDPRLYIETKVRKVVGGFYTVTDKMKDKIAENTLALDNPFSAQFYKDRCMIQ